MRWKRQHSRHGYARSADRCRRKRTGGTRANRDNGGTGSGHCYHYHRTCRDNGRQCRSYRTRRERTAASAASATTAPAAAGSTTVAVELKDFAIMLDKSTVSAGMVTFNVKNSGPSPHNFNVKVNGEEKGVTTLDPGKTATLTLNFAGGRLRLPLQHPRS